MLWRCILLVRMLDSKCALVVVAACDDRSRRPQPARVGGVGRGACDDLELAAELQLLSELTPRLRFY